VKIFHSLIFQILIEDRPLQPILHEAYSSNYRQLMSSLEFITGLFTKLVKESGPTFLFIDGVDEMTEVERRPLLKALVEQLKVCKYLQLFVSSRDEWDIANVLGNDVPSVRVDHKNIMEIEAYIEKQAADWLPDLRSYGADGSMCREAKLVLTSIAPKAKGMQLDIYTDSAVYG
jgi:hypothetical protein